MGGFGLGSYLRYLKFAYSGWFCDRMTCLIQNGHFVYMDGWSMKYEWSMLNVPPVHELQLERLHCCTVGRCSRPLSPPSFPSDRPRVEVLHYLQAGHHRPPHICLRWGRTQEEANDIRVFLEKSCLQLVKRKSDQTYDKGNTPARYFDEGSKKITDKNVVRTKIGHVLCLPVVTHESHHAAINHCWEFVVLENTNQMKTQSEALIWRFGVKNICKRLVFSSSVVLTSCRKSPSNSFFASSSCKIVSIRNNSKVSLGSRSCSTWQLFAAAGVPPPASLSPTTSLETQEPIFKNHIETKIWL